MRQHPISPVTEPTQYRAIGVVRGQYVPADAEQLTRGVIRTADGSEIEAVVLGRLLTLMRRHLDLAEPHLWVVYPRTREENHLHLQMVGVWEPSTLAQEGQAGAAGGVEPDAVVEAENLVEAGSVAESDSDAEPDPGVEPDSVVPEPSVDAGSRAESEATAVAGGDGVSDDATNGEATSGEATSAEAGGGDALPEGDDYFSVRGELIYTRPETGDLVIKVRQQPRADGSRPVPFKLQLKGEIPLEHLRHFVSLDLRRLGQQLTLESLEVLEPVAQRGNRGGKGRKGGGGERGGGGGGERGAGGDKRGSGARPRPPESGPARPAAHGKAISRPGR